MQAPDFIRDRHLATTYELCRTTQLNREFLDYENSLLDAHFQHEHAWWRQFIALPNMDLTPKQAAQILRESLLLLQERTCPSWTLSTSLELQRMARAALRMGAWKLLSQCLHLLLQQLRSHLPTQKRLSIATGLVAEWALASLHSTIATIYCTESLAWGNEPHRVRSYQSYAIACAQATGSYESLHGTLSHQAIECQSELQSRMPFAALHLLRVQCLEMLYSTLPESHQAPLQASFNRFFNTHLSPYPENGELTTPQALALSAALVMSPHTQLDLSQTQISDLTRFLNTSGRWKDIHLLHLAFPERVQALMPRQQALIHELDQCFPDDFQLHDSSPDGIYLKQLPTSLFQLPSSLAAKAHLCCI